MKKRFFLLCLIVIFSSCGLPSSEELEDMNVPLGLSKNQTGVVCSGTTPTALSISFYGYNPESFFSGYNVYIMTAGTDPANEIKIQVQSHIIQASDGQSSFSTTVEDNYIVKNSYSQLPSVSLTYLESNYPGFYSQPTKITYNITQLPNSTSLNISTEYSIGVTAISLSGKIETLPSNVITIQFSCQ
ncbi:MAG TPA: hypothetical protein DHW82_00065 [Spirochaetia bacterium]|nr:MAG: hypothetical protein A2Y41_09910 [Spirochaetes bacterium GWB1_36_13]HCL55396.1 hypothetical protein [Spirochaetia bacterium]